MFLQKTLLQLFGFAVHLRKSLDFFKKTQQTFLLATSRRTTYECDHHHLQIQCMQAYLHFCFCEPPKDTVGRDSHNILRILPLPFQPLLPILCLVLHHQDIQHVLQYTHAMAVPWQPSTDLVQVH
eukprot:254502_1